MKTFAEARDWLYSAQPFGIRLGLEPMRHLAAELRLHLDPHDPCVSSNHSGSSTQRTRWIHVAGTNGKGSVCAFQAAIAQASGLRTGLYTSPHLLSFRERIQVDGQPISETDALEGLQRIHSIVQSWPTLPTFFELVTALGLLHFQNQHVELAILETGLGGRLDATNVVLPEVAVITPIGLDHCQMLGSTLHEIAREKAGIFKPGLPIVCAPQTPEVEQTLQTQASQLGCDLEWVREPWSSAPLGLQGSYQRWNAALAVKGLQKAPVHLPQDAIHEGLARVQWPGRFQILQPNLVLDGAHNPHAARILAQTWREIFPDELACIVFGAMADKAVDEILAELVPIASEWAVVPVTSPRALSPEAVQTRIRCLDSARPCRIFPSIGEALSSPSSSRRLVCGSLFLIGETLASLKGSRFERSSQ